MSTESHDTESWIRDVNPRSILLRAQWVRGWLHSRGIRPGDPAYVDTDNPELRNRADDRYLELATPSVQAYLEALRDDGRQPFTGPPDDPEELRRRIEQLRRMETTEAPTRDQGLER